MTDNEIIKALLYCAAESSTCDKCILYDASDEDCECSRMLKRKAADIINRKQAEIERLNKEVDRLAQWIIHTIAIETINHVKQEMAGDAE